MIWGWRTSSESSGAVPANRRRHSGRILRSASSALLFLLLGSLPTLAARVTGSVVLVDSQDAGVRKKGDYGGVVIWLEVRNGSSRPLHPKTVQMTQRNKHFVPPVLAVPVGSTVIFPNVDPIFHNAFSNFAGQIFDVGLYPPGTDQQVRFRHTGIVRVFCNIHPTMSAVIVVLSAPYMAVSSADGSFGIEGVAAGEYRLNLLHERATEQTLKSLERDVTVGRDAVVLAPLEISESGYIQVPHKNKYGKEYPPIVEDRPMYPTARR